MSPILTAVDEALLDLAEQRYQEIFSGETIPLSEDAFFSSIEKDLDGNKDFSIR